jgi:hypothetical protein
MTAAHILRPAHHKKRKPAPPPVQDASYAPLHFTALMRRHDFPPGFTSRISSATNRFGQTAQEVAARSRETALANGRAYAVGTIPLAGTPRASKPVGWM